MTFYQGPLNSHRRLCRSEPGYLHFAAKDQSERARVADSGRLLKLGRLQDLQVQQVPGSDGQAFGLRQAGAHAAE